MVIVVRPLFWKAYAEIEVRAFRFGKVVRLVQPLNAEAPIFVTAPLMLIVDNEVQPSNALSGIDVTPVPKVTEVKLVQLLKTPVEMEVTLLGTEYELRGHSLNAYAPMLEIVPLIVMEVKFSHPANEYAGIEVTPLPIVTVVRSVQAEQKPLPKLVTELGMVKELMSVSLNALGPM
jgi:hypothetical protein